MTERCQNGKPVRSFHGMTYEETWPELDRRYWHPCTKIWRQPSCRGQVAMRWQTAGLLSWCSIHWLNDMMPDGVKAWLHRRLASTPHLCG